MTGPPDGWEAMADISRLGLETAAAVVERILGLSRDAADAKIPLLTPNGPPGSEGTAGDPARRLRADAERLIDLYAEWTRALVERAIEAAGSVAGPETLEIGPVPAGESVHAVMWLHVLEGPLGPVAAVRSTDLTHHDGTVIPASTVRFEPPVLDPSPTRERQQVKVTVDVPDGVTAGRYHGHVLVAAVPDVSLPVHIVVTG